MALVDSILAGEPLAVARLLTEVENNTPTARTALNDLYRHTGKAHLVGVTGAPGTGKSSLVNQIALQYRKPIHGSQKRIGILAVDPSSPFTGGAVMGDRVRMRDLAGDKGIFIRSMASRGSLGGLSQATAAMAQVMDAAGFDIVLIETVGAGQAEVDIARLAHTTLVVEAPGMGDDIQAIKAGILEIADILVVNKADLNGAEHTEGVLRGMLELSHQAIRTFHHHGRVMKAAGEVNKESSWIPPILRTVATDGTGVGELVTTIESHAGYLRKSGEWNKREEIRLEAELDLLITETLRKDFFETIPDELYTSILEEVLNRSLAPWEAVTKLLSGKA